MKDNKKIISKFPLKGVFEFKNLMGSYLAPVVKEGKGFYYNINLRIDCWRGSHSTFMLQIHCNKYNFKEAKEFVDKIYRGEINSPIIKGRAILPDIANRGTVIRCLYAPQEELREQYENDPHKRVIEVVKGIDEKNTNFTSQVVDYKLNEDKGLIAYLPVTCSSRTGMHWEKNFLFVYYKNNPPKMCYEGVRNTCRGNTYNVEGCL